MWIMRTDKAKNTAKVLKEVIKNPLQTEREIAENTWVSKSSVNRAMQEVGQIGAKDQNILDICAVDFEIVKTWQAIINERLKDKQEVDKMRTFEIAQTIEKSEKRYMLFKWEATGKDWWAKNITNIQIL